MSVNKVTLIGNVTNEPELRKTPNGHSVVSFGLATNRFWKDAKSGERKKATDFHSVVAWEKIAEIISKYVKKGEKLYVEGRIQSRSWEDRQGQKRKTTEIVANNISMLNSKSKKKEEKPLVIHEEVSTEEVPF